MMEDVARADDVAPLIFGRVPPVLDQRGQVVSLVAPFHGAAHHAGVADVTAEDAQGRSLRHSQAGGIPYDDVDPPSLRKQEGQEPLADETGHSGQKNRGVAHGGRV
jgi:hypothetical protein